MLRESFLQGWRFIARPVISVQSLAHGNSEEGVPVELPHDAMIHEARSAEAPSKNQSGFYPGGTYCYVKSFQVPEAWRGGQVMLEFEGVYKNSAVYVNGAPAGGCENGYTEFLTDLTPWLRWGEKNEIRVMVNNQGQPSSRWYSGSGIYRGASLLRSSRTQISPSGVRIRTAWADGEAACLTAALPLRNLDAEAARFRCVTEIRDAEGRIVCRDELPMAMEAGSEETLRRSLQIHEPRMWSPDTPYLYSWSVTLQDGERTLDQETGAFGVRTLAADGRRGLLINGRPVKLRGACIHHDNGILGACAFPEAEARRVRILKEAGFNCIRSAHNPMSRAMLEACDRQGMLVMDEYSDMWSVPKNAFDDAGSFRRTWKADLEALVRKDYNHPSVILYCLGNEIPEASSEYGARMCRRMDSYIKELDDTRLTVNAVSIMLSCSHLFRPVLKEILGDRMPVTGSGQPGQGGMDATSAANLMASIMNGPLGDALNAHPKITEALTPYKDATDITGLNYAPSRYALEGELNPDRLLLGTEDYPSDIPRLWGLVEKYSHVIGDMTWTGWDYIGEAGIGIYYYDGTVNFTPHWPDRLAYIGDINILGTRRPVSYWREIVYGLRKEPYIAVGRMEHRGQKAGRTAWMVENRIASWTWHGFEGQEAEVAVFSDAEEVELILNGKSLGRQPAGRENQFKAIFSVAWEPGELTAFAIRNGERAETFSLETAEERVAPVPECGGEICAAPGEMLLIPVTMKDERGRENLQARRKITVHVEGNATLAAFGSAAPSGTESYDDATWETFDGQVMAAVRVGTEEQPAEIIFSMEDGTSSRIMVKAEHKN